MGLKDTVLDWLGVPDGLEIRVESASADGGTVMRSLMLVNGSSFNRVRGLGVLPAAEELALQQRHARAVGDAIEARRLWGERVVTWPSRVPWLVGGLWMVGELVHLGWGQELSLELQAMAQLLVDNLAALAWSTLRTAIVGALSRALVKALLKWVVERLAGSLGLA